MVGGMRRPTRCPRCSGTGKITTVAKVTSLYDLEQRAAGDVRYVQLAVVSAKNLGGSSITDLPSAMRWLRTNAAETDEDGVVGEVNFCRDLI
jgi:hypothetical protein